MVQGGSKRKAASTSAEKENSAQSWCTYQSVLDVKLGAPWEVPEPPIVQYLEEVPLGMRGGAGDSAAQAEDNPSVRNVRSLQQVLTHSCAEKACRALLWLAVGGVFDHLPQESLNEWRSLLGQSWFLLSLALAQECAGDRHLQDWVTAALPFVFAQAIYRILCDGFADDRKLFTSHADKLVCKVTLVVHFEVTGFQMTADTVRKERRRLLQKHIFKNPHVNQREYMRGQRRQEMLESQNTCVGDQPLRFGEEEAQPLEDTQLDHVMQGRREARSQAKPVIGKDGTQVGLHIPSEVPPDLSVDRYTYLSEHGAAILDRQLEEFAYILGELPDEELTEEPQVTSPLQSPPSTPASPQRASITNLLFTAGSGSNLSLDPELPQGFSGSRRPSVSWRDMASDDEGSDAGLLSPGHSQLLSPKGTLRKSMSFRKASTMAATASRFSQIKAAREQQAKEEKARKLRQELLHRKVVIDKLPVELCQREFCTTWVSRCQMNLVADAQDQNLLNKRASEAHTVKMTTRPMPARPLSMPALRAKARKQAGEQRSGAQETGSGASGKDDGSLAGGSISKSSRISAGHRAGSGVVGDAAAGGTALPRVASAGGLPVHGSTSAAKFYTVRGETISLEPPQRLSAKVIMRRLEDQAKASKQMSFALYMKEYDIFTNVLKFTVDEKRLRDEEDACLRRSDALLSGPPKRRLAPEDLRMKGGARAQPS